MSFFLRFVLSFGPKSDLFLYVLLYVFHKVTNKDFVLFLYRIKC